MSATIEMTARGSTLSRRRLFQGGGALLVGFSLGGAIGEGAAAADAGPANTGLDPARLSSWIEIRPDNTVAMRTGNSDFGQGTVFTAYRQIVAEELSIRPEAITTIYMGDTDRTPDGGGSYFLLAGGSPNLRKAAAYVYQALLDLGAERLKVPRDQLVADDGVLSGGGKSVTYGDLVNGQELKLTIAVASMGSMGLRITGDPPTKPVSQYKVVGKSFDNSVIAEKVAARAQWVTDIRLPGMLHARIVRPTSLGSTLVSAGAVDAKAFPGAQVVVKGNLVAVVSPDEWEATQAALQVAGETKWTDWKGLPGDERLLDALKACDWAATPVQSGKGSKEDVRPAMAGAAQRLKATYFMPYMKHAPIGPTMAVADVRADGVTYIYTHTQNAQMLRQAIARMLGVSDDKVVVRTSAGPGHYGRSNGGSAGGEDEAVILSKALGRPVRVQWTRAEDMQWSAQSPAGFSDIEIGLDASGRMVAYQGDHHMPSMFDDRLVGAILAGLPTDPPPSEKETVLTKSTMNLVWDDWTYGKVTENVQHGHGARQIGEAASPLSIGLRDHSLRTPGQFQQNFPRELAISEAAAMAGADPLQFRIDHASDPRVVGVLEAVREASGWRTRPSTAPASLKGKRPLRGRGVSLMYRMDTYWACVCDIAVTPATGAIKVEKYTIAVDPGIVINPKQLKRQAEGGAVMGISHALLEEMTFDESGVTSRDWLTYPILTMADMPEIEVVLINRPEVGIYGGGSEAANALAAPAIAAAVLDATGKRPRRLPLSPRYVQALLKT